MDNSKAPDLPALERPSSEQDSNKAKETNSATMSPGSQLVTMNHPNLNENVVPQVANQSSDVQISTNLLPTAELSDTQINHSTPIIQPLLEADTPVVTVNSTTNQAINPVSNVDNKQEPSSQQSPLKTVVTRVKLSDELNIFDWFRTTDILNQIAGKAKSSVDTVITALDPGMKEYLYSGGNINIMVVSDSINFVSPIRDAFQSVFGRATVMAARYNPPEAAAEYPIKLASGFSASTTVAMQRIKKLRLDTSSVPQNQVVVAVQPCIVCMKVDQSMGDMTNENLKLDEEQPNKWFLTYNLVIDDPVLSTTLNSYSQLIPVDENVVTQAREAKFTQDFQERHLGFPISIDEIMRAVLTLQTKEAGETEESEWLKLCSGLDEVQLIHDLGTVVAHLYRRKRLRGLDD